MKLKNVIKNIKELTQHPIADKSVEIKGITDRSTDVEAGFIFVAIVGFEKDGHDYIPQAIEEGASVIIGQKPIDSLSVPYIKVRNTRQVLGQIAANFYNHPSQDKLVIGVTGTNGKTTTSLFLTHLLKKEGYTVSFFGTVFNEINGERKKSSLTTPNALMVQQNLSQSNDDAVVIEVSSQGLEQFRMEGMGFDYALFTNLQHDHLDYHRTIDEYFDAKKKLFSLLKEKGKAIINEEDNWGRKLSKELSKENVSVLTVGEDDQNSHYTIGKGSKGYCTILGQTYEMSAPMPGKYNFVNLVMASTVLHDLGHDLNYVTSMMQDLEQIPGRFEKYRFTDNIIGIIDYAHTAEALASLLSTIKDLYPSYKIAHIFGFRGNRDSTKREKMVRISTEYSDQTILTLDDLNGVEERVIEEAYEKSKDAVSSQKIKIIMDRTQAVSTVVEGAMDPTIVVITGKGHERYQKEFNIAAYSDKETFQTIIKQINKKESK